MSVRQRFRQAWPTTFGIHVFQMMLAGTFAVPIVASVAVPDLLVRAPVAGWLAAMRLGESLGPETLRNAALPLMAAALNYPWLSVAWLRALDQPDPFMVHARYALGRYRIAALIALGALLGFTGLGVAAVASVNGIHRALSADFDARTTDLAALAGLIPFAVLALVLATFQDVTYATVSRGESSLRRAVRLGSAAVSGRLVLLRAGLGSAQVLLAVVTWPLPRLILGPSPAADLGVLVITQISALALTSLRAVWLACVLVRTRA